MHHRRSAAQSRFHQHHLADLGRRVGLRMVDPGNLIHATDAAGHGQRSRRSTRSHGWSSPPCRRRPCRRSRRRWRRASLAGVRLRQRRRQHAPGTGELLRAGRQQYRPDHRHDQDEGEIRQPGQQALAGPVRHRRIASPGHAERTSSRFPRSRCSIGPNGLFVYVVNPDQTVALRPVEVTLDDGKFAVIAKGLDEKTQVVTNGQSRLQNGTRVVATPAKANNS